jgi:hypothetical protein
MKNIERAKIELKKAVAITIISGCVGEANKYSSLPVSSPCLTYHAEDSAKINDIVNTVNPIIW